MPSLARLLPSLQKHWPVLSVSVVLYGLACLVNFSSPFSGTYIDLATPIALGVLFFTELRMWPLLALVYLGVGLGMDVPVSTVVFSMAVSLLQAVTGALLLKEWHIDPIFRRKRDALRVIAITAGIAFISPLLFLVTELITREPVSPTLLYTIYLGSFLPLIILVPFLLRWYAKPKFGRSSLETFEIAAVFAVLVLLSAAAFDGGMRAISGVPISFALIIPFFWIALRLRPRFVTLGLVAVSTVALLGMLSVPAADYRQLLLIELFMLACAAIFLIIASQEEDRRTNRNLMLSQMSMLENAISRIRMDAKAREDFIAVLAHELRNPLAPIASGIDLLTLKGARDDEEKELLSSMSNRMESIRRLLEDLLDVSRILEGKVKLDREPLDLMSVLAAASASVEHYRAERHQSIVFRAPETPIAVFGDKVRLEQIFSNLLSNASKYSNPGDTITVSVGLTDKRVQIDITDTGVGLSSDTFEKIFQPFQQVYAGPKNIQGLGIGLALVRHFIELHEGSVRVRSEGLGKGSTFTILLPLSETPIPKQPQKKQGYFSARSIAADASSKLVLIADDNDAASGALGRVIEMLGYRVSYAYDGNQAVTSGIDLAPDVIFLDLNMPGLTGHEAAHTLRAKGYTGTLVALSGYGEKDAKSAYGDTSVFNHYLVKPVDISELRAVLPRQ